MTERLPVWFPERCMELLEERIPVTIGHFFECNYIRPASVDRLLLNESRTAALACVYSSDGGIYHIRMSPAEGRWQIRCIEQKGCWVQ